MMIAFKHSYSYDFTILGTWKIDIEWWKLYKLKFDEIKRRLHHNQFFLSASQKIHLFELYKRRCSNLPLTRGKEDHIIHPSISGVCMMLTN